MKLKNLIILFSLDLLLFPNLAIYGELLSKSEILKKSNACLNDSQNQSCKKFISLMEQLQLIESEKKRFRCQSSILGLQTELIEAYFFESSSKKQKNIMISHVIKNC